MLFAKVIVTLCSAAVVMAKLRCVCEHEGWNKNVDLNKIEDLNKGDSWDGEDGWNKDEVWNKEECKKLDKRMKRCCDSGEKYCAAKDKSNVFEMDCHARGKALGKNCFIDEC
ncbi:hypothetical protein BC939DRAFT_447404 [Gamsiella multidivaricata]|uniref:uncharacterized protein n=1 Tax=Gamsiella multidivaricata TaxID=101098 RepID=UPI00221F49BE|nr:uncharacterized protein BC939DRAFT_447404 [Gamsiella multidivaricata]KAI7825983.1 hypothetical protein BC939DRAFT_447404 [Gamsiella multidivaricata]